MNLLSKKWTVRRDDDFRKYFLGSHIVRCGGGCCCCVTFLGIGAGLLIGGIGGFIAGFRSHQKTLRMAENPFYRKAHPIGKMVLSIFGTIAFLWFIGLFVPFLRLGFLNIPLGVILVFLFKGKFGLVERPAVSGMFESFGLGAAYAIFWALIGALALGCIGFFIGRANGTI